MKATKRTAAPARTEPPNLVDLVDFINKESSDIQALNCVIEAVGTSGGDFVDPTQLLDAIGVIGRIVCEKSVAIQERANTLYDAYRDKVAAA